MEKVETDPDLRPLADQEIEEKLQKLPGWKREGDKILKTFEFASFSDGIDFISGLTPFFNLVDHHPDMEISYKKIKFSLTRFSIGGKITERDFALAEKIESAFRNYELRNDESVD